MNERLMRPFDAMDELADRDAATEEAEKKHREVLAVYERFLDELGSHELSVQREKEF